MSTYSSYIVSVYGPSLYWTLDGSTGATDQSGNGRNGSAGGGVSIGGFASSPITGETTCTDFDGTDDIITSSYNPFSNASIRTFMAWIYRDGTTTDRIIASSDSTDGPSIYIASTDDPGFDPDKSAGGDHTDFTNAWPGQSAWHLLILVFNESADTVALSIDGAIPTVQTGRTGDYSASPGNFQVGAQGTVTDPFDGKLAHIAVWEEDIGSTAIANIYAAAAAIPGGRRYFHQAGRGQ